VTSLNARELAELVLGRLTEIDHRTAANNHLTSDDRAQQIQQDAAASVVRGKTDAYGNRVSGAQQMREYQQEHNAQDQQQVQANTARIAELQQNLDLYAQLAQVAAQIEHDQMIAANTDTRSQERAAQRDDGDTDEF
jgi:hypothetical protein